MQTILYPQFVEDFACIGSKCEDSCCKGWDIHIDKATYKKYKNISDPAFRQVAEKAIKRVRGSLASDEFYAQFTLRESDGFCHFFTPNNLCGIQLQFGA